MSSPKSNFLKCMLISGMLIFFKPVNAQVQYNRINFTIDSLANMGLPKSALKEVDRLDELARKNNNASQQIKAVIYRMTFQSYLEENSLTAIITRLKTDIDKANYPVKPVLQSLLAQMYWNYYQQNRYQFGQRGRLDKPGTDFTKWDLRTIISQTSHLYDLSLHDSEKEQKTPVGVLDGVLDGDSTTRYLRPTIYDLLVQRAFDFFLTDEAGLNKPKLPFSISDPRLFSDSRAFAGLLIKTTDTASTEYKGIKYLQQATIFHLQKKDEEALSDIDLQRLKFLYAKSTVMHKDSLYLSALKQIALTFSAKPVSAEALVLQGQYYQGLDNLILAHDLFTKAVAVYPESLGGRNAATLIRQIEEKELSATVEEANVPDKPILGFINYKNINGATIEIYKLSESQLKNYLEYNPNDNFNQSTSKLVFLKKLSPIRAQKIAWPSQGDYRKHSLEIKIDALSPGNYVLLAKGSMTTDTALTGLSNFKVSNLAYTARINPDNNMEVRVMDRETGKPLSGVKVDLDSRTNSYNSVTKKNEWSDIHDNSYSDNNGLFISSKFSSSANTAVTLITKGDTISDVSKYINGALNNSDDDDAPENKTILFTDRQIYRPGQTIYFKGLQLQTLKGKSKIMPANNEKVEFLDVNDKQVASLKLKTNEFGTFSGSFIIPQTMLNGDVTLKTEDGQIEVKVEEYKRPTFQVEFLPVKESHKLNDSVTVKGTVTAFSGYGLSQAKVAYHITRTKNRPVIYGRALYRSNYNFNYETTEIKSDTITTDNQGTYQIKFIASPGNIDKNYNTNYIYSINADVTDASGETRSAETSFTVGDNNLVIENSLPDKLLAGDSVKVPVTINNLNGQPQKGEIKIDIYALKGPGKVFTNRLWESPDQFIISKSDFKNDFPTYAYNNEDMVSSWPAVKRLISSNEKVDGDNKGSIDLSALSKQPSGMYKVVISARSDKGDTTSVTKYVTIVNNPSKPVKIEDWVVPVLNEVKAGGHAEFLVGIDQKINVLMERYNGSKLISSKWIAIDKGQQKINVRITDTDKEPAVQFMMVYQNRIYSSYQKISILHPDENLSLRFLTFHNKLQPGVKEQWKLQLNNLSNEKQGAEMLAGLYDASLDDITPPQDWKDIINFGEVNQPNYFAWNSWDFINAVTTDPVYYQATNFNLLDRAYEQLNLFGYNHYGGYNNGYNNYLNQAKQRIAFAKTDKQLKLDYVKNAALVKNGYDINGRVVGDDDKLGIPGVIVKIKDNEINTTTNSEGYFKIRVPKDATLVFSFIGYQTKTITTKTVETLTITLTPNHNSLNEVVIRGNAAQSKREMTGAVSVVTVRYAQKMPAASSEQLLQGQAAGINVVQYGAPGASNQVFIRGIANFGNNIPKPITLRKNFNETAFFYPQLHTDEKGEILIDFTIPEALTRWKFRAFAHTQDLRTGYIENTVITQKQLSISANTPRFLREGDTITISARLANLTDKQLKGKVQLRLFNALNMQPVNLFADAADANQLFEITGGTTKAVSFKLIIPAGLDAITYRLTADAGQFSDGEENTLPVLPNRTLVTESMPMMVRAGQTRIFTFDKLVNQTSSTLKNKTLTLEYTQNPAWYAVQALPYLMEFPYECSEQIFSRFFANSLATNLVNTMPAIKQVFDQWKSSNSMELLSNLQKNQELKETLIEETPWLKDAVSETEQKKRIALLFDLNKMSDELKLNLDKLQKRQLPDGGFTWFGGDRSDRFITQHIAEGMGELNHLGIAKDQPDMQTIADNAMRYLDDQLTEDEKLRRKNKQEAPQYGDLEIHAWFTRSYFLNKPMSGALKAALTNYLKWAADEWKFRNVYEQGMIALTMQRYKKPAVTTQIERSLLETAQQSDDVGMYWAKNRQGYFWYESPVETQSLLIELFTEAGNNTKAVDEMKIWLLRNKQTSDWKTTKATAAACYALLLKGTNLLADTGRSVIKLDGEPLEELKPDVKADTGTGYIKTSWAGQQIKPGLGKVEITNGGKAISWGALHWQYLENLDKITSSETNIHLERKYFIQKQTDAGPVLTAVDDRHQPKTGDLLKVVIYLKADRDFEYVQLKDMRPAGAEPVDAISAYKYQDGLYYYQVTKDVATNFFISYLNKGNYVFEYQLRVAQPGNFSTGITTVQCIYAPEFNAHSQGARMTIKK